jgi:metalloprotease
VTRGAAMVLLALIAGSAACVGPTTSKPAPPPSDAGRTASTSTTRVDPAQAARLQRIMVPLIRVMDNPMPLDEVKVGIMDDQQINAANAGGDQFFVTTGLLQKANDDRLRAVLAHELSHQDLNHVAKAQVLGAGLGIGAAILNQIFPGTGVITPLAGQLVTSQYNRSEEYAADAHGVVLLRRAG